MKEQAAWNVLAYGTVLNLAIWCNVRNSKKSTVRREAYNYWLSELVNQAAEMLGRE